MPMNGPWSQLTPASIESVPTMPGVYEIGTLVRNTLYMGCSGGRDLRSCLSSELSDPRSQIRHRALYFRYETTARDEQRLRGLLEEYAEQHRGNLPPLNERLSPEPQRLLTPRPLAVVERHDLCAAC